MAVDFITESPCRPGRVSEKPREESSAVASTKGVWGRCLEGLVLAWAFTVGCVQGTWNALTEISYRVVALISPSLGAAVEAIGLRVENLWRRFKEYWLTKSYEEERAELIQKNEKNLNEVTRLTQENTSQAERIEKLEGDLKKADEEKEEMDINRKALEERAITAEDNAKFYRQQMENCRGENAELKKLLDSCLKIEKEFPKTVNLQLLPRGFEKDFFNKLREIGQISPQKTVVGGAS